MLLKPTSLASRLPKALFHHCWIQLFIANQKLEEDILTAMSFIAAVHTDTETKGIHGQKILNIYIPSSNV